MRLSTVPFLARSMAASAIAVVGLLLGAQPASAQGTCIEDVWKAHGNNQHLTCTAQDVTLSEAANINIITGGQCVIEDGERKCTCFSGGPVTFTADFRMDLTADTRYDTGFYIASDNDPNGDGAKTGLCSATASLATNTPAANFINLDPAPDVCGDITGPLGSAHNPLFVTAQITAQCPAGAPGSQLVLDFCTTWRQPGSNQVCLGTGNGTTTNGVFPGSPSKCNCGNLAVDIFSEVATITTTKTALPPATVLETGGSASYSVTVKNEAQVASVTLTSLTDDKYGNITTVHAAGGGFEEITATTCVPDADTATCEVGGVILAGQSCTCTFTGTVPAGDFPGTFTDVVKACGLDSFNNPEVCDTDDAVVTYIDVPQPPTLSKTVTAAACRADVTYAVVVTNGSAQDTLTLNSLSDDVYGNITSSHGVGGGFQEVVSTTCGQSPGPGTLPAVIAASGNYTCSFVGRINSCNTTVHDTVTGGAVDQDGNVFPNADNPFRDDATVTVTVIRP
jgi:hypothetical protein